VWSTKAEDVKLHLFVALNHSNICTICEIDEQGGQAFLAMEFLDGLSLTHRIGGKPMQAELILSLAIEIDAAHSEGIVPPRHKARQPFRHQTRPRQDSRFQAGQDRRIWAWLAPMRCN
jgi:hypothetical protein